MLATVKLKPSMLCFENISAEAVKLRKKKPECLQLIPPGKNNRSLSLQLPLVEHQDVPEMPASGVVMDGPAGAKGGA